MFMICIIAPQLVPCCGCQLCNLPVIKIDDVCMIQDQASLCNVTACLLNASQDRYRLDRLVQDWPTIIIDCTRFDGLSLLPGNKATGITIFGAYWLMLVGMWICSSSHKPWIKQLLKHARFTEHEWMCYNNCRWRNFVLYLANSQFFSCCDDRWGERWST